MLTDDTDAPVGSNHCYCRYFRVGNCEFPRRFTSDSTKIPLHVETSAFHSDRIRPSLFRNFICNFFELYFGHSIKKKGESVWRIPSYFSILRVIMSESTEISPVLDAPATENTVVVSTGDLHNIQVAYRLNGND